MKLQDEAVGATIQLGNVYVWWGEARITLKTKASVL